MQEYELIRSSRRTLGLEIKDGRAIVRAPFAASRAQIEAFVRAHEDWMLKKLAQSRARMEAHPEPDDARRARLIARAQSELPARAAHFAHIMGVSYQRVRITSARTRLGSCSSKGSICFSWRLMDYPDEAIDYVVVHELAHLIRMDHSAAFYAVIERVMPDYKHRRELLRQ